MSSSRTQTSTDEIVQLYPRSDNEAMTHDSPRRSGEPGATWATDAIRKRSDDRIEVVAAVDTDPERHELAEQDLGLSPEECYTDLETALSERPADIVYRDTAVDPRGRGGDGTRPRPAYHLGEADCRHAGDVAPRGREGRGGRQEDGRHHEPPVRRDKTTFRRAVEEAGDIDYLTARYTGNVRERGFYADYVYEMDNMLLLDGATTTSTSSRRWPIPCERVYAETWTPEEADYDGDCSGLVTLHFADGTRAQYEGSYANATTLNGWGHEQFRAECSDQTVLLDRRDVERFHADAYDTGNFGASEGRRRGGAAGRTAPLEERLAHRAVL